MSQLQAVMSLPGGRVAFPLHLTVLTYKVGYISLMSIAQD